MLAYYECVLFTISQSRGQATVHMMRMVMVVRRMSSASLVNTCKVIWAGRQPGQNHMVRQPMLKILA